MNWSARTDVSAAAGLFELLIDMEENTRSSFRLQQMILEELAEAARGPHAHAHLAAEVAPSPATPVPDTKPEPVPA